MAGGVPAAHPRASTRPQGGSRFFIGGSALPKALCLAALTRGIDVLGGYGLSETCPALAVAHLTPEMLELPPQEQAEGRCRTGRSSPLVDLRIVDEQMRELPRDGKSTGEIVARSPWLTPGYFKDQEASEALWAGGWLHTGDVAYRDSHGYVQITDRAKDLVRVGGEWVSSLELEDLLAKHPAVSEVAVIGVPDEEWGEHPLALVVRKAGPQGEVAEQDLGDHAQSFAAKGVVNRYAVKYLTVQFVDVIEKTSVGKINKLALRKKHA